MENLTGETLKGYELLDRMGSGGFGAVYRAYQSTLGREVAVKIILPGYANHPDFIRRFEAEAQLVARLEHLHIVPLYDYWREPGGAYLVMRWLRGGSVKDALREGPFDLQPAAVLLEQVASALATAHAHDVVHRDLKPSNILLDEEGNAYLADFGIAKELRQGNGEMGQGEGIAGSPGYLSPEQARRQPLTPQTDIYSLGVTLYEIITGEHPFPGVTGVDRLFKHIDEPLPPIATLPPDVEEGVNAVIQRATAKDPRRRYEDVLALAVAFREAARLDGEGPDGELLEELTLREQEILHYIVEGYTNRQIAQELFVEHSTVKWHIRQLYAKLGVRSRRQAIVKGRELELLVPGDEAESEEATATTGIGVALPKPLNPYKGLRAFETADSKHFFGREALIQRLLSRLSDSEDGPPPASSLQSPQRFLAVVGPSGSGKSSLVKAGLVPALWQGAVPGSERWFVVEMVPGARPLDELEVALIRVAADQAENVRRQLERDEHGLLRAAELILPRDDSELVLVIDQFEELFTLADEAIRAHFLSLLAAAATDPRSRVRLVVTLRADYYDRPLHYPEFGELLRRHMVTVLPLSAEELQRAIVRPAEQVGVRYKEGLAAAIIDDTLYQPGALPLLQYALTELFEQREGRLLSREAYEALGGITGALARRAEELYGEQEDEGRETIRQMFLRLVVVEDDSAASPGTRRRVPRSELGALVHEEELMDEIVDTYAAYRLLTLDHDPDSRSPTVEVAHEALIREWQRLRGWLDESRADLRMRRQLARAAQEWRRADQDPSYLLRGVRLEQFENWSQATDLALTGEEWVFLEVSLAARRERQATAAAQQAREAALEARSRNRLRYLVGVLATATVVAAVLSLLALNLARQARQEARLATSRELAAAAVNNLDVDPERSALLALAGLNTAYTIEAENALHRAVPKMHLLDTLTGHDQSLESLAISPDGARFASVDVDGLVIVWEAATGKEMHRFSAGSEIIFGMVFSPDGRRIITASNDQTARVWDSVTGDHLLRIEHGASLSDVAISPDGNRLATAGADAVARVWDASNGQQLLALEGHEDAVRVGSLHPGGVVNVAYTPDGQRIVTGGADGTVRLWDAGDGHMLRVIANHVNEVYIALGRDRNRLLTAGFDGQVKIWDIAPGKETSEPALTINHEQPTRDAAYSPDGRLVAVASQDGAATVWDAASGQRLLTLVGHAGLVNDVAFTPDGRRLVTVAEDRALKVWELEPGREQLTIVDGHPVDVAYSPDAARLASAQSDGTIAIRDSASGQTLLVLSGHPGFREVFLTFSPGGKVLASASWDMTAKLWDVTEGEELFTLAGHTGYVWQTAFSPDGTRVATASGDMSAKIWDVATGKELFTLSGHMREVVDIAYSPDGSRLATTGNCDNTARIWDASTGQELMILDGGNCLFGVAFSPDGKRLATGRSDGSVIIWDISGLDGQVIFTLTGQTAFIPDLAFSPDGKRLASASFDGTAKVWDLVTRKEWLTLPAANSVTRVAFSPDGSHLATAGFDGQIRIWILELDELVALARSRLTRTLTPDECRRFLHREECPDAP